MMTATERNELERAVLLALQKVRPRIEHDWHGRWVIFTHDLYAAVPDLCDVIEAEAG